jgi:hypothetical protein
VENCSYSFLCPNNSRVIRSGVLYPVFLADLTFVNLPRGYFRLFRRIRQNWRRRNALKIRLQEIPMIIGRRYAGNEFATKSAKQLAISVIRRSADHRALANGSFAAKESQVGSHLLESLDATPCSIHCDHTRREECSTFFWLIQAASLSTKFYECHHGPYRSVLYPSTKWS